jgi:hypothetical protein
MVYFIELIRYLPGRAEPEVLGRIKHADRDPEGARAKAKNIFLQTKGGRGRACSSSQQRRR